MARTKLQQAREHIQALLEVLPDNPNHPNDGCWEWCWEQLNHKAQTEVMQARKDAVEFLAEVG